MKPSSRKPSNMAEADHKSWATHLPTEISWKHQSYTSPTTHSDQVL